MTIAGGETGTPKLIRETGRALGGAFVFALPMLMTMEMWWLGFYMDRLRLGLLVILTIPLLMGLSRRIGLKKTRRWGEDLLDALFACGVAAVACAVVLAAFGVIGPGMSLDEIVGKITLQTLPASIGALLARSQFGEAKDENEEAYSGELFLMAVGALFLGLNVAPTEEMVLISYMMTPWHAIGLVLLSIGIMHGFVFAVGFVGGTELSAETPWWSAFVRFTLPGYAIAATISLFVLWTFGRTDEIAMTQTAMVMVVLGFPSAIGAAAARLIL